MLKKLAPQIGATLLFIAVTVITVYFVSEKPTEVSSNNASTETLFATTLPDENGQPQAINQWKGKIIVLNFWATWCPPCLEEMPELSVLNTQWQDKNVVVIGIALDEVGLVKTFDEENNISYPLLASEDNGSNLAFKLGNDKSALPYTVIIKPDGSIAKTYFGRVTQALLEKTLAELATQN